MKLFTCTFAFKFFVASRAVQLNQSLIFQPEHLQEWDLDATPDANATGRFIFDNVASLLQRWTNTRYRNGHSIVPGTIAPNTLLYHGRRDKTVPETPQWVATDPEHSLLFSGEEGWLLTFVSTRPLKVIYFDGSSGAKMPDAADSQDIIIYGEVRPDKSVTSQDRINGLCEWGKEFGLDGFVRMQVDFEIMLCNFTEGVELLSTSDPDIGFDVRQIPIPTINLEIFESINAGSWHNNYPGDTRIQLNAARLVSFYEPALAPSLMETRQHQERWQHSLRNLTKADARMYMRRLEDVLRSDLETDSGVDWQALAKVIVDRYSERLLLLRHILSDICFGGPNCNLMAQAKRSHDQLRIMMQPYISASAIPANLSRVAQTGDHSWVVPIYKQCSTIHTAYIVKLGDKLAPSEKTLLSAVRETTREICRVTARMWVDGVYAGLDRVLGPLDSSEQSNDDIKNLLSKWLMNVSRLMEWLDWSIWVKCDPACSFEELCYMPTWPFFRGGDGARPGVYESDWKQPRPYCIRRVGPYSVL